MPGDFMARRAIGGGWVCVRMTLVACATVFSFGCDDLLTVENPQNILDQDLDTELAIAAVANGVQGDLAVAWDDLVYMSAHLADELIHTGSDSGIRRPSEGTSDQTSTWLRNAYDVMVAGVFVANDAVRRFRRIVPDADSRAETASALVAAGFLELGLADNMCVVTLEGGPALQPAEVYPIAEASFTEALEIATVAGSEPHRLQALAGRARARLAQGDDPGARADAAQIPDAFVFYARYSQNSGRENNLVAGQTRTGLRKESGVHPRYYTNPLYQNDSRTPMTNNGPDDKGADGTTQFVQQEKYAGRDADIRLASWQEARLIEAEAALNLGDVSDAVALIDEVRAAAGLPPYAGAVTADAVRGQLMTERSAELWLEAQRLRDLRRTADPYLADRSTCIPLSINEENSNPNLR